MGGKEEVYDFVTKVVLIGDASVGKSNILSRYIKNEFSLDIKPTLGVEFGAKILSSNGKRIRLQIWDTAGQEKYKSITNSYYVNSKGVLAVFDLTMQSSFNSVDKWVKEVREVAGHDISILLVGNKIDLASSRQISESDAKSKAENLGIKYIETSAFSNENINEAFQTLVDLIYVNYISVVMMQDDESDDVESEGGKTDKVNLEDLKNDKGTSSGCSC